MKAVVLYASAKGISISNVSRGGNIFGTVSRLRAASSRPIGTHHGPATSQNRQAPPSQGVSGTQQSEAEKNCCATAATGKNKSEKAGCARCGRRQSLIAVHRFVWMTGAAGLP